MSYDVNFAIQEKNTGELVCLPIHVANITYNVRELIKQSSGWDIGDGDNGLVKDLLPQIHQGWNLLSRKPNKYKQYESPNGWGTIEGVKNFYKQIIQVYDELSYTPEVKEWLHVYID